jgi:hypothetical protein
MFDVAAELGRAAAEVRALRSSEPPLRELLDMQLEAMIAQATAGGRVLADPSAMMHVAEDPREWYRGYREYGVLPWGPVAWGIAESARRASAAGPGMRGSALRERASELLDDAEDLCQEARGSERLGAVFGAAHMALPLFAAARELLNTVAAEQAEGEPDSDVARELQGAEEARMACIELLTQGGQPLVGHVFVALGVVAREGLSVPEAVDRAIMAAAARLPFYPERLASRLRGVPGEVAVGDGVPADPAAFGEVAERLRTASWRSFDGAFADRAVVAAAAGFRDRYGRDG